MDFDGEYVDTTVINMHKFTEQLSVINACEWKCIQMLVWYKPDISGTAILSVLDLQL
jgi:spore maturation protein CgeB